MQKQQCLECKVSKRVETFLLYNGKPGGRCKVCRERNKKLTLLQKEYESDFAFLMESRPYWVAPHQGWETDDRSSFKELTQNGPTTILEGQEYRVQEYATMQKRKKRGMPIGEDSEKNQAWFGRQPINVPDEDSLQ